MFRKNAVLSRRLGGARDDDAHDVTDGQRTFMTTPLMSNCCLVRCRAARSSPDGIVERTLLHFPRPLPDGLRPRIICRSYVGNAFHLVVRTGELMESMMPLLGNQDIQQAHGRPARDDSPGALESPGSQNDRRESTMPPFRHHRPA